MQKNLYSNFLKDLDSNIIEKLILIPSRREVQVFYIDGSIEVVPILPSDQLVLKKARENNIPLSVDYLKSEQLSANIFSNIGLLLIVILGITIVITYLSRSLSSTLNFLNKSNLIVPQENIKTTFDDIAGISEIKDELGDIVSFLVDPKKLENLGGSAPRGILITGPPGTGKTLLAKAIAGEAKVPFFYIAGSEFVELFAGIGASRVKDIFIRAKDKGNCIIFIDEIDSIGRKRGNGSGINNEEREQTLNQLLTEMDGFDKNNGILVIAATNRPEILDEALTRPGRFDMNLYMSLPDRKARLKILNLHSLSYPISDDVRIKEWSFKTSGFSGAELKNLLNESAIICGRKQSKLVSTEHIQLAFEKIKNGINCTNITPRLKRMLALKQISKAIVAFLISYPEKIGNINILNSKKNNLFNLFTPYEDFSELGILTKSFLLSKLKILLAPRAAEIIINGRQETTTASADELAAANNLLRVMIEKYGFSSNGLIYVDRAKAISPINIYRRNKRSKYSQALSRSIDKEINTLAVSNLNIVIDILKKEKYALLEITERLLQDDVLSAKEFFKLLEEFNVRPLYKQKNN